MPVTKKKGAIFAVYADTPPRAGPAPREPSEPREPPRDGRRALANIEPAPTRRKASSSEKRRALAPRSPTRSSRGKMDVFVDLEADKPAEKKRSALAVKPLASKPLSSNSLPTSSEARSSKPLPQPLAAKPLSKPVPSSSSLSKPLLTKKTRAPLAKRARSPTDKENTYAPPDSPASRTRSKLRLPDAPSEGKSKPKKTARAFTVFADPLADVSEAYGASGNEPEGFREQGASRKSIVSAPLIRSLIAALIAERHAALAEAEDHRLRGARYPSPRPRISPASYCSCAFLSISHSDTAYPVPSSILVLLRQLYTSFAPWH